MFYVGVDLGQTRAHTAIAVIERPTDLTRRESRRRNRGGVPKGDLLAGVQMLVEREALQLLLLRRRLEAQELMRNREREKLR